MPLADSWLTVLSKFFDLLDGAPLTSLLMLLNLLLGVAIFLYVLVAMK